MSGLLNEGFPHFLLKTTGSFIEHSLSDIVLSPDIYIVI